MPQTESRSLDSGEFVRSTESFRRELLAHCYRMLGSVDDAEDLVQETYLRAWRSYGTFEGRSTVRAWLYRIATNACLTALEHRGRRPLPSGLGGPSSDPEVPPEPAAADTTWLQPVPDSLVRPDCADPATVVTSRESLRLALVASLQYLPGRQRAVLILRDVLGWPAAEVADTLGTTIAAVKSTLQRARARLDQVSPAAEQIVEPAEPELRALLDRYIAAFENSDEAALSVLLHEDVRLEATPFRSWYAGLTTCVPFLSKQVLGAPGDWRMFPAGANGQPAAVAYLRGTDRRHHAYGVVVLAAAKNGITCISSFGDPGLVARFGFPPVLPTTPGRQPTGL